MNHLDIYSTSYGKKKAQESNWLFDFRTLKVGNQPDPDLCRWSATNCSKALKKSYKFTLDHPNRGSEQRVMSLQSPGSPNQDNFGTPPWASHDKKSFKCRCHREVQIIIYGGRWWLPLSLGRGESCESRVAHGSS
jgi:hypothetical protein